MVFAIGRAPAHGIMHARNDTSQFRTTDPGDPLSALDAAAYGRPGGAVSDMVRAARARAWDPRDLESGAPAESPPSGIMPETWYPELRTPSALALPAAAREKLGDAVLHWLLSGILHGEQAALTACAQMCARFANPATRAFAAVQAEEEARHVEAFSGYIADRWGEPFPAGEAFGGFLRDLIATPSVPSKIVGINLLIEGFAMGAFANIRKHTRDARLRALLTRVMGDEAAHHQFGILWAETATRALAPDERAEVGKTVARGFRALYLNLVSIRQRRAVFAGAGLDWRRVLAEVRAQRGDADRAAGLEESINPLTVLAQMLRRSGLVGENAGHALGRLLREAERV